MHLPAHLAVQNTNLHQPGAGNVVRPMNPPGRSQTKNTAQEQAALLPHSHLSPTLHPQPPHYNPPVAPSTTVAAYPLPGGIANLAAHPHLHAIRAVLLLAR